MEEEPRKLEPLKMGHGQPTAGITEGEAGNEAGSGSTGGSRTLELEPAAPTMVKRHSGEVLNNST